ncbi:hypothetical protein COP2_036747 [Malus domestica]
MSTPTLSNHRNVESPIHEDHASSPSTAFSIATVPHVVTNINPMVTRSKVRVFKPKTYSATKHPLPSSNDHVPTTYFQASKFAHWRNVMQEEFNAS